MFRQNVAKNIKEIDKDVQEDIRQFTPYDEGHVTHSGRNAIKMRKVPDSPLIFNAYFDKSSFKSGMSHINEQMQGIMLDGMRDAIELASQQTSQDINKKGRSFKSKIKPKTKASGDLYETIGDSLTYEESKNQGNQFASFKAGSRNQITGDLSGVDGSRTRPGDPNLIQITEEGTSPFFAHLVYNVFEHPAKRHLKNR